MTTIPSTQAIVTAGLILLATLVAALIVGHIVRRWLSLDRVALPNSSIFENLARLAVWAIGGAWALDVLGVHVSALIAALGVAGIAISLGLQDTLSNFFSGLQIVLSRQVQPGERVRLSTGEEGIVHDVTWRNTMIVSGSEDLIIIPNSLLGRGLVTNFSRPASQHVVSVPFTLAYGTDLARATLIAAEAADAALVGEDCATGERPVVRTKAFGDAGIECSASMRVTDHAARVRVVDATLRELYARFSEAGIAFGTSNGPAPITAEEPEDGGAPALAPSPAE